VFVNCAQRIASPPGGAPLFALKATMNSPIDPQLQAVRTPPNSIEAEQSVLGGLLLDNSAWDKIGDLVSDADFYRHDHN